MNTVFELFYVVPVFDTVQAVDGFVLLSCGSFDTVKIICIRRFQYNITNFISPLFSVFVYFLIPKEVSLPVN